MVSHLKPSGSLRPILLSGRGGGAQAEAEAFQTKSVPRSFIHPMVSEVEEVL